MLSEHEPSPAISFPVLSGRCVSWGDLAGLAEEVEVPLQRERLDACSFATFTKDAQRFEEEIFRAVKVLRIFEEREVETAEPEVFHLSPLSRRRVNAKVRRRGPASFYFVDAESELEVVD